MEGYYRAEFGMSKSLAEVTPWIRLTDKAVMAIVQKNFGNIFRDVAAEVERVRSMLPKSELEIFSGDNDYEMAQVSRGKAN